MSKPSGGSVGLITRGLNLAIAGALALMAIFVFANVIMRYFFHSGLTWAEEVSRFLFIWLIFLGAIVAFKANEHLGIDALARRLSVRGRRILFAANSLIILATLGLTLHGAWLLTVMNLDQSSPAINLPYAYVYSSGLVGLLGMAIIVVINLYKLLSGRMDDDALIMSVESEEMADRAIAEERK
ncbi:TRAP transporter small permease subunit [Pusillimonas sp. TS35]|uniref:TRAP transporter small permease n=1 Tax=Paracandidimonas lactea TaxID=2895524 RepID=UPI0013686A47|nr:TRAP transporter small permease [Paracandidimonas lactea]MYN11748.1 TRAP transporter small permease subunit [Pusillimonas sp. TS35]